MTNHAMSGQVSGAEITATAGRGTTILGGAVWGAAALILALCVYKIAASIDITWDTLAYHWPFTSRLAGLCPESCYRMSEVFEVRFLAFPKAVHYIQAAVLLLGEKYEYIGFVSLASIMGLCVFLKCRFNASLPLSLLAFFAIPLVLIHATSHYVDLATNVAATIALLLTYLLLAEPESFKTRHLAGLYAACAFLANAKLQMIVPAVAIAGSALLILLVRVRRGRAPFASGNVPAAAVWGICAAGIALIALNPLVNTVRFGNPVYPIALSIPPLTLPGPESVAQPLSVSHALTGVPAPVRWLMSVFEVNAYGFRHAPWTVDQGYVSQDQPSFRMGGYNVVFVLANLAFLGFHLVAGAQERRRKMAALAVFSATTLLTAFLPLAHELRYYMFWMLLLVSLNLIFSAPPRGAAAFGSLHTRLYATVAITVLLSVNLVTAGRYLSPLHARDTQAFVQESGIAALIAREVPDGATVCLRDTAPLSYLYAPMFHGGRPYRVIEDGVSGCDVTLGLPSRGRL